MSDYRQYFISYMTVFIMNYESIKYDRIYYDRVDRG